MGVERLQPRADDRDAQLHQERPREDDGQHAQGRRGLRERILESSHVRDHEHVQHHHGARIDDHLCGGQELGPQQEEQHRQRDQVDDQRQHAVERVALEHDAEGAGNGEHGSEPENDGFHRRWCYSPSLRSGVRSTGSASSISLVKMRSDLL